MYVLNILGTTLNSIIHQQIYFTFYINLRMHKGKQIVRIFVFLGEVLV